MLEQLNLNNLALSVEAEVDFTPGMICITGETGAGKSLVVDALYLGEIMLEQLNLNNLALSVEAEVDFTPGMICITGETGAGKSLVVDALSLVLGAKADANMVRQGEKQLEVNARFSLKNQFKAIKLLDDYGFLEERKKAA